MTWRAEVRTPGLPAGTRRLGDLRLECEVGMEAELISNTRPLLGLFGALLSEGAQYCNRSHPLYLFFAERPVFAVALVDGARREVLSVDNLYMGASRNPDWKRDLRYCDCEVLLDRAYTLPLGDRSWPDDALVEFETMEGGSTGESAGADVPAAFEEAVTIPFDSGYQVRVYRERTPPEKRQDKEAPPPPELVQLVAPSGIVTKSRVR
jgi:hypothetical protein